MCVCVCVCVCVFVPLAWRLQVSTVTLFLNGVEVATKRVGYPKQPSSRRIQACVGTPRNEASPELATTSWQLGPLYLLEDCLAQLDVNAIFCAGPTYDGCFHGQDGAGRVPVVQVRTRFWEGAAAVGSTCQRVCVCVYLLASQDMLCAQNFEMLRRSLRAQVSSLPVRQRSRRQALGAAGRLSADVTAAMEQVDATTVMLPRLAEKIILTLSARRAVVQVCCCVLLVYVCVHGLTTFACTFVSQSGGQRQGRLTRLYSTSSGGVVTSFLEGGAVAHCRTRVADILPSLCDGGVVVALGVLAAATSTDAVTAATRLLVALTLSQTSNLAGMKRLNMCVRTVLGAVCVCVLVATLTRAWQLRRVGACATHESGVRTGGQVHVVGTGTSCALVSPQLHLTSHRPFPPLCLCVVFAAVVCHGRYARCRRHGGKRVPQPRALQPASPPCGHRQRRHSRSISIGDRVGGVASGVVA